MSLTGDPTTDAMVGPAQRLIWAVRENNGAQITEAFAEAARHVGGDMYRAAAGLAVVLAAMVPDDRSPEELLYWAAGDRTLYLELRTAGLGSSAAAIRSASCRVVPLRRGRSR